MRKVYDPQIAPKKYTFDVWCYAFCNSLYVIIIKKQDFKTVYDREIERSATEIKLPYCMYVKLKTVPKVVRVDLIILNT